MKVGSVVVLALSALVLAAWLGTRVPPRSFAPYPRPKAPPPATVPVPDHLPEPVRRFYGELYGPTVPRVGWAVISGRGRLRIAGVPLRGRFRFTHDAGSAYRHGIDLTLFGAPVLSVHERYVEGRARLELPMGVTEGEPKVDEAAHLALWAEAVWFPSLWITDARARWSAVDDTTARLTVPYGEDEHTFVARFDPGSGLLRSLEVPRYKEARDAERTPWLATVHAWGDVGGRPVPIEASLTWGDEGSPWAVFRTEEVLYGGEARLPGVRPEADAAGDP